MNEPTRLFDIVSFALQQHPVADMLNAKENKVWRAFSTAEIAETAKKLSAGLLALGISGNDGTPEGVDKIAIISPSRPEWIILDLAAQQIGVPLVPIYPTTNPLEIEFIFNDAQVKYAFAGTEQLCGKLQDLKPQVPSLQDVFSFDNCEGFSHWQSIVDLATADTLAQVDMWMRNIQPDQLATIIYTSGTTGTPKGVMLTHRNLLSNVQHARTSFPFDNMEGKKALSFLPLNHIFERTITYIYLLSGLRVFYAEGLETIGENLLEVQPHGFTTVPRLLEKVHENIMKKRRDLKDYQKKLFDWAVGLGLQYDAQKTGSLWYRTQLSLANTMVFSKWRQGLGNQIEFIITGGAACQPRLLRLFNGAGIPVFEGYGPTENSPVISVNRRSVGGSKFGTVGPVIDGQEVRLAEDGEILVQGPSVMKGYYKRPDLTDETIVDGWLLTGDIGVWEEAGGKRFLKITDRKKELFKTSGGKYVAPQPIENKLKESAFIEQALVVGAERKFVGALIVPNADEVRAWMKQNGKPFNSLQEAISDKDLQKEFRRIVEEANQFFNQVEQVKKFELIPREWSVETGEMTPKLSLKRKIIMEKFRDNIERIYN